MSRDASAISDSKKVVVKASTGNRRQSPDLGIVEEVVATWRENRMGPIRSGRDRETIVHPPGPSWGSAFPAWWERGDWECAGKSKAARSAAVQRGRTRDSKSRCGAERNTAIGHDWRVTHATLLANAHHENQAPLKGQAGMPDLRRVRQSAWAADNTASPVKNMDACPFVVPPLGGQLCGTL